MFEGLRRNVLVMILAGGEGTRLKPLTEDRAKPAVPFGGRYRIIDFALSNFVNSGFYKIKILTQYKSDSLNKHISRGWRLSAKLGHYVEAVPAQMRRGPEWYKGSADAIFQNMNLITDEKPDFVIVFGADHIYKMDVSQMLEYHEEKGAICTVAAIPVSVEQAKSFGVIQVDEDWRIIGFQEKPAEPKTIPGRPDMALASMGNYIFSIDTITESIERDAIDENSTHDFGKNIIPALVDSKKLFAYDFSRNNVPGMTEHERGYWRDVGDIDAYWAASMDLVAVDPVFNLYNRLWPIYGESEVAPPAKFVFADDENKRIGLATDSLVSEGCIVSGGRIHRTILGPWARINSYSHVEDSVIMDRVDVGRHAQIRRAIL
ncbi:glucose-1-phosphate adenylyltransferase, partial [bacterium]|nr:glucose-1-phosphate adenylyltransferase [bacterium]